MLRQARALEAWAGVRYAAPRAVWCKEPEVHQASCSHWQLTGEKTEIAHLALNLADILLLCALPAFPALFHLLPYGHRLLSIHLMPMSCLPYELTSDSFSAHPHPFLPSALLVVPLPPFSFSTAVPSLFPTFLLLSHLPQAPVSAFQTFLTHLLGSCKTLSSWRLAERRPTDFIAQTQASPHFSHMRCPKRGCSR